WQVAVHNRGNFVGEGQFNRCTTGKYNHHWASRVYECAQHALLIHRQLQVFAVKTFSLGCIGQSQEREHNVTAVCQVNSLAKLAAASTSASAETGSVPGDNKLPVT